MTNAATAIKEPAPAPIRRLIDDARISTVGVRNLPDAWIVLPTAEDVDRFYETPGRYLDGATDFVQPHTIVHIIDDKNTIYSQGLALMVRLGGSLCDVVEIVRKQLGPPALPFVSAPGWSISHDPARGWHVLQNGSPVEKLRNLPTEHAARAAMNIEVENSRNRR